MEDTMGTTTEEMEERYSPLPPAIKRQVEQAEKLFDRTPEPEPPAVVEEPPVGELPIVEEPPAEQRPPEPQSGDMVPRSELERAEQRYQTLKGMYDRDIPHLHHQVRFLNEQLQTVQASLEAKGKVTTTNLRENPKIKALQEEMNPTMFDNLAGALEDVMSDLDSRYKSETDKIRGEIVVSKEEAFTNAVNSAYPNWKQLWASQEGQAFLSEVDELTGFPRHQILTNHYSRLDSRMFIRGLDLMTGKGVKPPTLGSDGQNPDKLRARVGAVRPGATTPTRPQAPPQVNKVSPEEARQKLRDITAQFNAGRYPGNEAEYEKEYSKLFTLSRGGPSGG
jgi:hypothetical protein